MQGLCIELRNNKSQVPTSLGDREGNILSAGLMHVWKSDVGTWEILSHSQEDNNGK